MASLADLEAAAALFARAAGVHRERRPEVLQRVVRWEQAPSGAEFERPLPLYHELANATPPPARKGRGGPRYGYDQTGQIVVAEAPSRHGEGLREELFYEEDGALVSVGVEWDPFAQAMVPALVTRTTPGRERPQRYVDYRERAWEITDVEWDGDRPVAFHSTAHNPEGEVSESVEVEYAGDVAVALRSNVYGETYRRPQLSPRKALAAAEERLVEAIPAFLADVWAGEPLGYVLLVVDAAVGLPPTVAAQSAADRDRMLLPGVPAEDQDLWNAGDLTWFDEYGALLRGDPIIGEAAEHVRDDPAALRKLLTSVAKQLNDTPWQREVPLDCGFFVAAVEAGHEEVRRDLKASVPRSRRGWLQAHRLL